MTGPIPRQRKPYRFPAMAVKCTWCKASAGELCRNQRATKDRRQGTHESRDTEYDRVMSTRCPERICQAPARQPCTITPDIHQARLTAAPTPTTTP